MRITDTAPRAVPDGNQGARLDRRTMLALTTMAAVFTASSAIAQQPDDVEAVKAASKAFYSALSVLDDGSAMGKVWARAPYVTYVGPVNKSIIVGWDAQKEFWNDVNKRFSRRTASLIDEHIHVNGNLAWEIGVETGQVQMKEGTARTVDWIATNVYEKAGGRWLMVSHHAQARPL